MTERLRTKDSPKYQRVVFSILFGLLASDCVPDRFQAVDILNALCTRGGNQVSSSINLPAGTEMLVARNIVRSTGEGNFTVETVDYDGPNIEFVNGNLYLITSRDGAKIGISSSPGTRAADGTKSTTITFTQDCATN